MSPRHVEIPYTTREVHILLRRFGGEQGAWTLVYRTAEAGHGQSEVRMSQCLGESPLVTPDQCARLFGDQVFEILDLRSN